jgi:hypothetical protein
MGHEKGDDVVGTRVPVMTMGGGEAAFEDFEEATAAGGIGLERIDTERVFAGRDPVDEVDSCDEDKDENDRFTPCPFVTVAASGCLSAEDSA